MKLTYDDKVQIYELRKQGYSLEKLSNKFGINNSNIRYMIKLIDRYGIEFVKKEKNRYYSPELKQEMIDLTRREYDLLATLMGSKKVLTREQLLESVWKYESATETNIVDVYIRYLRSKLDVKGQKSYIKTVRGVGYTMQE